MYLLSRKIFELCYVHQATLSRKNKYTNRKQLKRKMNASQDTANQSSVSQDSLLSVSTLNENANSGVCTAALQSLRSMLSASSCKMQAALHKVCLTSESY